MYVLSQSMSSQNSIFLWKETKQVRKSEPPNFCRLWSCYFLLVWVSFLYLMGNTGIYFIHNRPPVWSYFKFTVLLCDLTFTSCGTEHEIIRKSLENVSQLNNTATDAAVSVEYRPSIFVFPQGHLFLCSGFWNFLWPTEDKIEGLWTNCSWEGFFRNILTACGGFLQKYFDSFL